MHQWRALLTSAETQSWSPIWPLKVSSISLEKRPIVFGLKENSELPTIYLLAIELKRRSERGPLWINPFIWGPSFPLLPSIIPANCVHFLEPLWGFWGHWLYPLLLFPPAYSEMLCFIMFIHQVCYILFSPTRNLWNLSPTNDRSLF